MQRWGPGSQNLPLIMTVVPSEPLESSDFAGDFFSSSGKRNAIIPDCLNQAFCFRPTEIIGESET